MEFGSADDPLETATLSPWRPSGTMLVMGGLSLIGAQWRTAGYVAGEVHSQAIAARVDGTLRAGIYGTYDPDIDDLYDAARLLDYVRYAPPGSRLFMRLGPTSRQRLGTGHLVNFYNTKAAWDARTIGVEGAYRGRAGSVEGFADNFLFDRVVGGRVAFHPLFWARESKARSLEIGATYVSDLEQLNGQPLLTGYGLDMRFVAATIGDILVEPFTVFSRYRDGGTGFGVGTQLTSDNFVDVARFRLRLAVYYSGDGFIPGHIGAFYRVSNREARVLKSEGLAPQDTLGAVTGTPMEVAPGGTSVETELRLLFFRNFELWYSFRRHFGGESLSEYHMRLFFRTGRITAYVGQDRAGLKSFFSLFNDLGDLTWMEFRTDYNVTGDAWIFVRAIYSFEEVQPADDGSARYLVQRRFEPFTGIKLRF
ncbi:MAG: hypothetical protein KJO98_02715 [Rhodothermia bacterium]|nr:hypothetical protein [Rhodothermia bacterium]